MAGKGTVDVLFLCKKRKYPENEKSLYIRFVDLEKAFDKISKKSCGVGNEKEIPKMIVNVVISQHKEATTKIKVGYSYSDEFLIKVGVY